MTDLGIFARKNRERHVKLINSIIHNTDAAEDIVQEAYLRAHFYMDTYDEEKASFNTWFNKLLFNTLKDSQKAYATELGRLSDDDVDSIVSAGCLFLSGNNSVGDSLNPIRERITATRNVKHKRILALYYLLGYTAKEIASSEDTTVTNVTTICNRFKEKVT